MQTSALTQDIYSCSPASSSVGLNAGHDSVVLTSPAAGTQLCSVTLLVFRKVKFPLPY